MDATFTPRRPIVLRGLDLRSAVVLLLLEHRRPVSVRELVEDLQRAGFGVQGRPSKEIADALRWEVRRGRAVRHGRGVYGPGVVAKVTKHRMRARVAATRNATATLG